MTTSGKAKPAPRQGRSVSRREARDLEQLERLLFDRGGRRRLPHQRALDRLLARLSAEELFWFCETRAGGPLYLLPTREFIQALGKLVHGFAPPGSTVLEVAAGDGFLSRCLRQTEPAYRWLASDSGAWENPRARMTAEERRTEKRPVRGVRLGMGVERQDAVASIRAHRPEVVVACWLPPGRLFERILRCPSRLVIEIGASGGVTSQGEWNWRFAHVFPKGPIERLARSRLDAAGERRTQVTVYFGRQHPAFAEERPGTGDWLSRFKPAPRTAGSKPRTRRRPPSQPRS